MSTKNRILELLEQQRGESISGEHLAGVLGISRNAVWKAIKELQKDGYNIVAVTNKGYCLSAENMIINSASSVVYVDKSDADKLIAIVKSCEKVLKDKGASTDPDMEITVSEVHLDDDLILSESDKNVVLAFLKELKNGVRTMSPDIEDLVESSANLGILNVTPTSFEAGVMSRSCSAEKQEQQLNEQKELANALNCKIEIAHAADAWEYNPDGNLEKIMRKSYKKLFGKDMKVIAVHAGLECGTFAKYNNELDMVAIGPTITDPHSINEKIEISSIEKVWSLLKETLINID